MAIAFIAATDGGNTTAGSLTYAHNIGAAANRFIVVTAWDDGNRTPTVTYAGESVPQIINYQAAYKIFAGAITATGSNNVVVSWGGGGVNTSSLCASYSGVKQTGQPDVIGTKQTANPATTLAASVTTVVDNSWAVGFGQHSSSVTAGANTTVRLNGDLISGAVFGSIYDSNAAVSPAGVRTLTINMSSGEMNSQVISLAPTPAAPATVKTVNGVATASVKTVNGVAMANIKTINGKA